MKKLNILMIMLITSFVFMACEKEESNKEKESSQSKIMSSMENPYDYCGELHNEVLYNYALEYNLEDKDFEQFHNYLKDYDDSLISFNDLTYDEANVMDSIIKEETINMSNGNTEELILPEMYSAQAWEYIESLYAIYDEMVSAEERLSPSEFSSEVQSIENQIIMDDIPLRSLSNLIENDLEMTEFEIIMMGCAIARYSYEFWDNAYYDSGHPWHGFMHDQLKYFDNTKVPDWLESIWNGAVAVVKSLGTPFVDMYGTLSSPTGAEVDILGLTVTVSFCLESGINTSGNVLWR